MIPAEIIRKTAFLKFWNQKVYWCFDGVFKENIGQKWNKYLEYQSYVWQIYAYKVPHAGKFLPQKVYLVLLLVKTFHTDVHYSLVSIINTEEFKNFEYSMVSLKLRGTSKTEWKLSSKSLSRFWMLLYLISLRDKVKIKLATCTLQL